MNIRTPKVSLRTCAAAVVQQLEARSLLCGLPHEQIIEAPVWDPDVERRVTADGGGSASGDAVGFVWSNRGQTSGTTNDRFSEVFGANAETARKVVDALLADWGRAITSFNRADGTSSMQLNISMNANGTGFSAGGSPAGTGIPADGKPRSGSLTIGRGNDTNGDGRGDGSGWFLDPTPASHAEFLGDISHAFTGSPAGGSPGFDLYTVAGLELTHALGLITGTGWNSYKLGSSGYTTVTSSPDKAEAGSGNTGTNGYYAIFDGPTIDHLMTTYDSGLGNWGSPIHTAGGAANVTINGVNYRGSDDTGNAIYESTRYLPNEVVLRILGDAYGYSIQDPKTLPNFFAVLAPDGKLTVRGMTGAGGSMDAISITESGTKITVSVNIGNDVPGSGALPGAGDLGAYVAEFDIGAVTSIVVNAGDGNDTINISTTEPITVNGGTGNDVIRVERSWSSGPVTVNGDDNNDTISIGLNNNVDAVDGGVTVSGNAGTDSLRFEDSANTFGDSYTLTGTTFTRGSMNGTVTYNTTFESVVLQAGTGSSAIAVRSLSLPTTVLGGAGNDTITLGNTSGSLDDLDSSLQITGEAGTDAVVINDSGEPDPTTFSLTSNTVTRQSMGTATYSAESFTLNAGGADDTFNFRSAGSDGNYRINGGGGNDRLYVGRGPVDDYVDNIDGPIVYDAGTGSSDMIFFANGDETSAGTFTATASGVVYPGMASVSFSNAEQVEIEGGSGNETFDITPSSSIRYTVYGGSPTSGTGDRLIVQTSGTASPTNTPGVTGAGQWTFGNRLPVIYSGIETIQSPGLNVPPTLSDITASPNPVTQGGSFTITANGVSDPDGSILAVYFYRENNGNPGFQSDDLLLSTDSNSTGGWTASLTSSGLAVGTHTYYARAVDNASTFSPVATTSLSVTSAVNVAPSIVSLVDFPDTHYANEAFTLIANGASDPDNGIFVVRFYLEFNNIPGLQATNPNGQADLPLGPDNDGSDGWSNTVTLSSFAPGTYTYYAQAEDFSGALSNVTSATNTIIANPNEPRVNFGGPILNSDPLKMLFVFNQDVSASLDVNDVVIRNLRTNATVPATGFTWDAANKGASFNVAPPPDGDYRVTLIRSGVNAGGLMLAADYSFDFAILRGDANGDRTVNFDDLLVLAQNYGQTNRSFSQGNFNFSADGKVDFDDLLLLAQRYGTGLATTAPAPVASRATRRPGSAAGVIA